MSENLENLSKIEWLQKRRECCYAFDNLEWYLQKKLQTPLTVIETGSSSEGGFYNDIDRMHFRNDIITVEDDTAVVDDGRLVTESDSLCLLSMNTSDCYPGFTRLQLKSQNLRAQPNIFKEINGKMYVACGKLKTYLLEDELKVTSGPVSGHGPALTSVGAVPGLNKDMDFVSSIKCADWPFQARDFLRRMQKMSIAKEKLPPCLLVPVAHPQSDMPDIEFRMSFSLIEKYLIQRWSAEQFDCYSKCKHLCNRYVKTVQENQKGISSYFVKTAMFWMIERNSTKLPNSGPLVYTVQDLLKTLYKMIQDKHLPNYFISECNLISLYSDQQIEEILSITDEIMDIVNGFDWISYDLLHQVITDSTLYSEQCKGYIGDFIRFCLTLYTKFEYVNNNVFELAIKDALVVTDNTTIQKYISTAMTECLALFKLYDAFDPKFSIQKERLIEESRQLLLIQPEYPIQLIPDNGLTKFVLLGLLYHIIGDHFWSTQYLMNALVLKKQHGNNWRYASFPIFLPSAKWSKPPVFFGNDIISLMWILNRPKNVIHFDSHALCLYLMFIISGDKKYFQMLKDDVEKFFPWSGSSRLLVKIMEKVWASD